MCSFEFYFANEEGRELKKKIPSNLSLQRHLTHELQSQK